MDGPPRPTLVSAQDAMKLRMVILSALLAAGPATRAETLERWFEDHQRTPAGKPVAEGPAVSMDRTPPKAHGAVWAPFGDLALKPGGSVTLSCTWKCNAPPGEKSGTQLRVALLGAPRDSADYRRDLRGFVLNGGFHNGNWETILWERVTNTPAPCVMSNTALAARMAEPEKSAPEQTMRIVLTVKQTAARTYDVSGFWGSHAFTFNGVQTANELAVMNCAGFLNGRSSGFEVMTIENCRVTSP